MKITITEGWGDCETCGSYGWHRVECPEIEYKAYYDGHTNGGPSIEECLTSILEHLGHSVERITQDD